MGKNKLKSSSHQQEYSKDNAVKRNKENCQKTVCIILFQTNKICSCIQWNINKIIFLSGIEMKALFFFLNIVDGANVFVMVNFIKLLQSGPGIHLWILGMMCTVIL